MSETAEAQEPQELDADAGLPDDQGNELAPETPVNSEADSSPAEKDTLDTKPDDGDKGDESANGYLKRIDRLTSNWRSSERELAELREQNQRMLRQLEDASKPAENEQQKTLADFDYDENQYRQYLFEEADKRAAKTAEETAQKIASEAQQRAEFERQARAFESKASEFAKATPDYFEVVQDRSLPITQTMAQEIRASEIGPELAYHLGKNPEIADEISTLSDSGQIRRMVQLETRLQNAKSEASQKSETNAPPPPKSVKGSSAPSITSTADPRSDKLSDAEWFALAEKEQLKRMKNG